MCVGMLPMNTSRPLFANPNMRKAVNYAVDRTAYGVQAGPLRGDAARPVPAAGRCPATRTSTPIPRIPTSSRRAISRAGIPETRCGRSPSTTARPAAVNQAQAQIVRQNLIDIGFEPTMVGFAGGSIYDAIGTRRRAVRPRRERGLVRGLARPLGLHPAHGRHDDPRRPGQHQLRPISTTRSSTTGCTRRTQLIGDERYDAFQQIEHDLVRDAAPWAAMRTYNNSVLLLAANRVPAYSAPYGSRLAQLCLRPEITTDDSLSTSPTAWRTCRLPCSQQRDGQHDHGRLRDRRRDGACRRRLRRRVGDADVRATRAREVRRRDDQRRRRRRARRDVLPESVEREQRDDGRRRRPS